MWVSYHSVTQLTTAARTLGLMIIKLPRLKENTIRMTATLCNTFFHSGLARLRAHFKGLAIIIAIWCWYLWEGIKLGISQDILLQSLFIASNKTRCINWSNSWSVICRSPPFWQFHEVGCARGMPANWLLFPRSPDEPQPLCQKIREGFSFPVRSDMMVEVS